MSRFRPTEVMYLAPGASSAAHALHLPGAMPAKFPAVDDHVVEPETGTEMIHGEIRRVMPAAPPHAKKQCNIASVLEMDVAPGYVAATELLTRVNEGADFATDACILKEGVDPATGSRYLEEISFEVKHTQSEAEITERARMLARRGVRRVFAIYVREGAGGGVEAGPVKEWVTRHGQGRWVELDPGTEIVDRCFAQPVKVQALLDRTEARKQVARALWAQKNPVLVEAMEERASELSEAHAREMQAQKHALSEAHARAIQAQKHVLSEAHARAIQARDAEHARALRAQKIQTILDFCDLLGAEVTAERRTRMDAMSGDELDALCRAIRTARRWPEKL